MSKLQAVLILVTFIMLVMVTVYGGVIGLFVALSIISVLCGLVAVAYVLGLCIKAIMKE